MKSFVDAARLAELERRYSTFDFAKEEAPRLNVEREIPLHSAGHENNEFQANNHDIYPQEGPDEVLDEIGVLTELASTAPLRTDENNEHFFWVEAGLIAEERLAKQDEMSDELFLQLGEITFRGINSFDALVRSNLRLVLHIAKRSSPRIPLEDRFQAGCDGLVKAIERFDFKKGIKFSTYAVHWIRQSIYREVYNTGTIVRTPVHVDEKIGWDKENRRVKFKGDVNLNLVDRIWLLSLYDPIDVDECDWDTEVVWATVGAPSTDSDWISELGDSKVSELVYSLLLMAGLDERYWEILLRRFGFFGEEETLDQVGSHFGLTRERVRQMQKKSLAILASHPTMFEDLEALPWQN